MPETRETARRHEEHESWHRMTVWKCPYCDVVDGPSGAAEMPLCVGPTTEPHPPVLLVERTYMAQEPTDA